MDSNKTDNTKNDIQQRLLDAAEGLFCDKGFNGTSIRDITAAADCNVAAVNYHFGGKESLYAKVFQRHLGALREIRLASIEHVMSGADGEVTLERLLSGFAKAFVEPLLDKRGGGRLMTLMVREMLDPHLRKGMFAEEIAIPTLKALGGAMAVVCPGLSPKDMAMSIISLVGQLLHVIRVQEFLGSEQDAGFPMPSLSEMIDHIVRFSVAGIEAAANSNRS